MTKSDNQFANEDEGKQKLLHLFTNGELIKRVVSSIALASVTIFLTYYSFETFLLLTLVMMVLMCWEWGHLTNNDNLLQLLIPISTIFLAIIAFLTKEWLLFMSAICAGGFLLSWTTHYWWRLKWALFGLAYLLLPILSLVFLRSDPVMGFLAVLFILTVVWATDSGAYFTGRYFGGEKLAPNISPNKTWAGLYGGLFAGFITGAIFALSINQGPIILSLLALLLSALSQLGDLAESAIKRHFGVKDASQLIPGHGGILDRLDGVIIAAIGAAIIAFLRDHQLPGQALLIW